MVITSSLILLFWIHKDCCFTRTQNTTKSEKEGGFVHSNCIRSEHTRGDPAYTLLTYVNLIDGRKMKGGNSFNCSGLSEKEKKDKNA